MKINWHQNPLLTTVDVDERDRQRICMYLQNEDYVEILCDLSLTLEEHINKNKPPLSNKDILRRVSAWARICDMDEDDSRVAALVSELQYSHMGDCTCVAASCMKCWAETALGISTLEGLGKHEAAKIQGVFGSGGNVTIDEAIEKLSAPQSYVKPTTWPDSVGYEEHIPRWDRERVRAVNWLTQYKKDHGF
jgi:hypothetical protein